MLKMVSIVSKIDQWNEINPHAIALYNFNIENLSFILHVQVL